MVISLPFISNFESLTALPPVASCGSILPCHPGAKMPPPGTLRAASCPGPMGMPPPAGGCCGGGGGGGGVLCGRLLCGDGGECEGGDESERSGVYATHKLSSLKSSEDVGR